MDTSYAMAKFGLESKDILKSRQKGCWHYMKYFFIFSSIIQFLIILGLVLFMLYGNAHGGTELRLKSVEKRYNNLTIDHAWLKGNFSLLREKLASTEKEVKNCSDTLSRMRASTISRTNTSACPRPPLIPNCNYIQATLDHLNITCNAERLKLENAKMAEYIKFNKELDSCTKAMMEYTNKDRMVSSENAQLQREKEDLGTQIKLIQKTCTTIDEKFKLELQNLINLIESTLKPVDPYDSYLKGRCQSLIDTINTRIDNTLSRLRQDVNNVVYENTDIKVSKARINEDLVKCNQDKGIVTAEKNNLVTEKTSLDKQLRDKTEELNKSYAQFMKKQEELENCRKSQMRPVGFTPFRTGEMGKRK